MLSGMGIAALLAGASARDTSTALALGGFGLVITIGSIAGIIALARLLSKRSTGGGTVAAIVVGMVFLSGFVLLGLGLTGCGAMMAG
jgi:hypothetical protein